MSTNTSYETEAWKAYAARRYHWREVTVHRPDGTTEQGRVLIPDYGLEFLPLQCAPTERVVCYEEGAHLEARQAQREDHVVVTEEGLIPPPSRP